MSILLPPLSQETYQLCLTTGGWANLSTRAKLLASGADTVRFLNGQMTQNVKKLDSDQALYTCITNLKGKIQFDAFLHQDDKGIWLDSEPETEETLLMRLDRYLIADEVTLEDQTTQWDLWHVWGTDVEKVLLHRSLFPQEAKIRLNTRARGHKGIDLWIPKHLGWQPNTSAAVLDQLQFHAWQVLNATPRFPSELNEDHFPQEADLESSTMDFHKGCYLGQEILSRIKMTGKMPQMLVQFELDESQHRPENSPVLHLTTPQSVPQPLGPVTSLTRHPVTNRLVGLAYLRHHKDYPFSLLIDEEHLPKIPNEVQLIVL